MAESAFSFVRHTTDAVTRLALHGELDRDTTVAYRVSNPHGIVQTVLCLTGLDSLTDPV